MLSNLVFSNSNASYSILQGTGTTGLTLTGTGGSSPAAVTVISGTHSVEAPILLDSNLVVSSSGSLTLGGSVSDGGLDKSLTLDGGGTLILAGTDSYTGGTRGRRGNADCGIRHRDRRRDELDDRRGRRVDLRPRGRRMEIRPRQRQVDLRPPGRRRLADSLANGPSSSRAGNLHALDGRRVARRLCPAAETNRVSNVNAKGSPARPAKSPRRQASRNRGILTISSAGVARKWGSCAFISLNPYLSSSSEENCGTTPTITYGVLWSSFVEAGSTRIRLVALTHRCRHRP